MTKYRESKAALTSKTYDRNEMEGSTENIYDTFNHRQTFQSNQFGHQKELHEKLDEFATHNDSLEEILKTKSKLSVAFL